MSKEKYLWSIVLDQSNLPLYIYLNENDEKNYGNIISESDKMNHNTKYTDNVGNIVSTFNNQVGLTDINKFQYQKLQKLWKIIK
tara:strand:+ start:182 stop:433 length:252 start_codon:yes stop_codon:yes gene_type:complete